MDKARWEAIVELVARKRREFEESFTPYADLFDYIEEWAQEWESQEKGRTVHG